MKYQNPEVEVIEFNEMVYCLEDGTTSEFENKNDGSGYPEIGQ